MSYSISYKDVGEALEPDYNAEDKFVSRQELGVLADEIDNVSTAITTDFDEGLEENVNIIDDLISEYKKNERKS